MEKDRWKGLFRPENKKMRSNILLALLLGVLLLAAGRSFSDSKEEGLPQTVAATQIGLRNVAWQRSYLRSREWDRWM